MTLNCFQFQLFYQGFQFQGIQLLFPAFFDVVEEIINQRPGNYDISRFPLLQEETGREFKLFIRA